MLSNTSEINVFIFSSKFEQLANTKIISVCSTNISNLDLYYPSLCVIFISCHFCLTIEGRRMIFHILAVLGVNNHPEFSLEAAVIKSKNI